MGGPFPCKTSPYHRKLALQKPKNRCSKPPRKMCQLNSREVPTTLSGLLKYACMYVCIYGMQLQVCIAVSLFSNPEIVNVLIVFLEHHTDEPPVETSEA